MQVTNSPADAICEFVPPFLKYLREGTTKVGLTPARFQTLQALGQGQPCTMVELADRLSVTKRNITTLIDGLEKDGLAKRRPHPTDRRSKLVELTEKGTVTLREASKYQRKHLENLVDNLDPEQQVLMTQALTKLTETILKDRAW